MTLKIRKKIVDLEAVQWTGHNHSELSDWGVQGSIRGDVLWIWVEPEGCEVRVPAGHYIVKGVAGEFYPVADELFPQLYDVLG